MFFPSKHELETNSNKSDKVYRLQENCGERGSFLLFLIAMKKRGVRGGTVCVCDTINIIRVGEKTHKTAFAFLSLLQCLATIIP